MGRKRKGPGRRPVIDAAAKVAMLAALEALGMRMRPPSRAGEEAAGG